MTRRGCIRHGAGILIGKMRDALRIFARQRRKRRLGLGGEQEKASLIRGVSIGRLCRPAGCDDDVGVGAAESERVYACAA
jgi:hypothetical protein